MDPVGWPTTGSEQNLPWSNALDANPWRLVNAAPAEALDLNDAGRQDYLRALHEQDPELHRRVLELIGSDGADTASWTREPVGSASWTNRRKAPARTNQTR